MSYEKAVHYAALIPRVHYDGTKAITQLTSSLPEQQADRLTTVRMRTKVGTEIIVVPGGNDYYLITIQDCSKLSPSRQAPDAAATAGNGGEAGRGSEEPAGNKRSGSRAGSRASSRAQSRGREGNSAAAD
eukprot:GHVU01004984.1.p1 GENE.GHVU01004984.1~~GHVU01004984.1.p1  ORF type:complete len:145 (+),score=19.54 GHVU01004984.1:47-436(+)